MTTTIFVRSRNIHCEMELHIVRVYNDNELKALLAQDTEAATSELVASIKAEYRSLFTVEYAVSDASVAVEIWGHVYAERMADAIKHLSSIALIDKVADKIIYHSEIIDMGERGHDENRFVWDGLAHFKSLIASFLPDKE